MPPFSSWATNPSFAGPSSNGGAKALRRRVAASPASTVLLTGETDTGKDLAAKVLHYNSERAHRIFVNITCSAIPEQLLESELFGHERPEALELLERDRWPGNIIELRNAIERAMLLIDREWIRPEDFAASSRNGGSLRSSSYRPMM